MHDGIPSDSRVGDSKKDYEDRKVIRISYCRNCNSTKYRLERIDECDVHICEECGNDTWN
ncbi:MAG: hypothetical protein ACTSYI_17560 [Promethearchaeota archaeon]